MAKALDDNAILSNLLARLQQSRDCFDLIRPLTAPDLLPQVRAGPITDTEWSVLAANGAVASKLRQSLPSFEAALRAQGRQVTAIRIRVQSPLLKP
jgi:hypothetical protein